MTEPFHARLRRLRTDRGLSMRALAEKVHVPETTYREWEKGRAIQGQPYSALAQALNVSLQELMTGEKIKAEDLIHALEGLEGAVQNLRQRLFSYF